MASRAADRIPKRIWEGGQKKREKKKGEKKTHRELQKLSIHI